MANYSLVINSRFRPFEFDEMLKPVMMAEQAHREIENAYSDLYNQAATVDSMANEQTDPISYKRYKDYAADLKAQADELATNGLNPATRKTMLDLKGRYTNEIVPIQNAYKRKAEQMKAQADILAKDPTHFFARTAANTSLDDYLNNATLDLTTQNYSGALLTQQVAKEAEALSKAARNDPKVKTQLRHLLGFNYETIRQNGFSPESIREAILRTPNANPILTGIVDRVMASSGIANWNYASDADKQRVWSRAMAAANEGLWSAVGQTQYGAVVDDRARAKYESDLAEQRARNAFKREHPNVLNSEETGSVPILPVPLRSKQEISDNNTQIQEYIDKGYMIKDVNGNWRMTKEGMKEYEANKTPRVSTAASGGGTARLMNTETALGNRERPFTPSRFKQFMDAQNGGKAIMKDGKYANGMTGPGTVGNLFARAINKYKEGSYDTYHSTEYRFPIGTETEQKAFKDNILASMSASGLEEVDYNGKTGAFEKVKPLKSTDLAAFTPVEVRPHNDRTGKGDDTIIWLDKDGNILRTRVPATTNLWASANSRQIIKDADMFGEIADSKYIPMYNVYKDASGNTRYDVMRDLQGRIMWSKDLATEDDQRKAKAMQNQYLQELMFNTANYNTRFSTEPVKLPFTPR